MEKYYFGEHESVYREMQKRNVYAWDQFHDPDRYHFDAFMMRPFLKKALDYIHAPVKTPMHAFEYGCGTGAGAVLLAQKGFQVEAIDISPTAINMAENIAAQRGLKIQYNVCLC